MEHSPFLVYKASAGAGKTYALVKEYLKMVFEGGEERLAGSLRSVLAITFTNKAAAEMKERILGELQLMAARPVDAAEKGMGADILCELSSSRPSDPPLDGSRLQRMAAKLYAVILHAFSDLSVSTIDSFTNRVVRTFAHDFGKPMNFEVVVEEDEMLHQAVARLMALAGTEGNEELTEVLREYAETQMEEDKGYRLEPLIENLASELFKENVGDHMQKLAELSPADFLAIRKGYVEEQRSIEESLKAIGRDMLALLHEAGLDESLCHRGKNGYYGYLCKLSGGSVSQPTSTVVAAFENGELVGKKCPARVADAAAALLPQLRAFYGQIGPLVVQHNTCRALQKNLYATALLGILESQMRLYESDQDVLHLSDFNRLINQMVEEEDNPAPFIYERLGNRYKHFLIDEFQDTSVMQWHNMVPLLENGVSQGMKSMVVGDGKQSIYRFRQGDVEQFVRLPQVCGMKHHGQVLSRKGNSQVVNLRSNHRSSQAVVQFNNEFFSHLAREVYADNPLVQDIYVGRTAGGTLRELGHEELRQEEVKGDEGYVQVELVKKADAEEGGYVDVSEAIHGRIVDTINRLVEERGYRYKDIVVLARSKSELAAVGAYLSEHSEIPQTSTESFYLRESHAVMAVMAVLRLIRDRSDRMAAAELRHRMFFLGLLTEEELAAVNDTWTTLLCGQKGSAAERVLPLGVASLNLDYLAALDLYGCCEETVRMLQLDGFDTSYVASLLNRAAAFSASRWGGVGDFVDWFDSQEKLSAASSDDLDAVRLMTVHKAKGLGCPVVICPLQKGIEHPVEMWVDLDDETLQGAAAPSKEGSPLRLRTSYVSLSNKTSTLFDDKLQEERRMEEVDELNILYVAFTRAKERLYVFSPDPTDTKTQKDHDRRFPALLHSFAPDGCRWGKEDCGRPSLKAGGASPDTVEVDRVSFADWSSKVSIASPAEKKLTGLAEEKVRFGNYAHDLLARVRHPGDLDEALRGFTGEMELGEQEASRLEELVREVVCHPDTARFFDDAYDVKNECELVVKGMRLRPDRVVLADGETWVVDFKTGQPMAEHSSQVARYCQAVRDMGLPKVKGYLIYLQSGVRVERIENFEN